MWGNGGIRVDQAPRLTKHKDVRNALRSANEGLADKFKKNIDKYNKKAKKSRDYLKKLNKKKPTPIRLKSKSGRGKISHFGMEKKR